MLGHDRQRSLREIEARCYCGTFCLRLLSTLCQKDDRFTGEVFDQTRRSLRSVSQEVKTLRFRMGSLASSTDESENDENKDFANRFIVAEHCDRNLHRNRL